MTDSSAACPLCGSPDASKFHQALNKTYFRCAVCLLTFVSANQHIKAEAETKRYLGHNNNPEDPAYQKFYESLVVAMSERLKPNASGLDFGSGHGSPLALLLRKRALQVKSYDPYFAPDQGLLEHPYDFVVSAEVFEHLSQPGRTWDLVSGLLGPGAVLGLMTLRLEKDEDFHAWWYRQDPTHIAFYRDETLRWMADSKGLHLEILSPRLALFSRS